MKLRVLEEIKRLRDAGEIDDETYLKLRKVVERPFEIDLGDIFAKYGVSGNSLVLDVAAGGSGTGPKILGRNIIALDISIEEIDSAVKEKAYAQWICADARKLPFKDNSIEFVITFIGLAYIHGRENKLKVLKEAYRTLKNDGSLLLAEPKIAENCRDYMGYFVVYKKGVLINETILGVSGENIMQTQKLLVELLQNAGFETNIEKEDDIFVIVGKKKLRKCYEAS